MRRSTPRLATGVVLALLAASCASTPASSHSASTPGPVAAPSPPCRAGELALGDSPQISPATEEHGDVYTLANRGSSACTLAGYPSVTLYDSGAAVLPFRYTDGDSQYITVAPPATVRLRPGASAWVLVAQTACVLGNEQAAVTIRISMPRPSAATVTGPAWSDSAGVSQLWYCRGGPDGARPPVFVSPIEPTRVATVPPGPA
jgi:hypothetical protein